MEGEAVNTGKSLGNQLLGDAHGKHTLGVGFGPPSLLPLAQERVPRLSTVTDFFAKSGFPCRFDVPPACQAAWTAIC